MPSYKLLKGVAHDIAHHSVSGLSYIHPHLSAACREAHINRVQLDVSLDDPLPDDLPRSQPLTLSTRNLHVTFIDLLEKYGFSIADIKSAILDFSFSPSRKDDYTCSCKSTITTNKDRI